MRKLLAGIAAVLLSTIAAHADDKDGGLYFGATSGYVWGTYRESGNNPVPKTGGAVGGFVIGYAQKSGDFVLGVEADMLAAGVKGELEQAKVFTGTYYGGRPYRNTYHTNRDYKTNGLASLRVKLQFDFDEWFKPYVTGGLAVQRFDGRINYPRELCDGAPMRCRQSDGGTYKLGQTQLGLTIGAGASVELFKNMNIDIGYQFYRFDEDFEYRDPEDDDEYYGLVTTLHSVRVGLNYKF